MKYGWYENWKRVISLVISFAMVLSMFEIAPGSYAFASELEDTVVSVEDVAEPTEPPKPVEEPAVEEPAQTQQPAAQEQPAPSEEQEVASSPEPDVTEEAAATPEATATPDAAESAGPEETPELTQTPEPTQSPEPTQAPDPLVVSLSSDVRSAFVGGDAIGVSLRIEGGVPEYTITYHVYLDGAAVEDGEPLLTAENASDYSYVARAFGVHTIEAAVSDAIGQTEVVSVSVPVAEHDTGSLAQQHQKAEQVKLTGNWRKDMLAVAASQLGYRESERDFIVREDGAVRGYTVYGDWYGQPYEEWDAMFVSFCADLAGIPMSGFPQESSSRQMLDEMAARGAYHARGGEYEPQAGDVVFYRADEEDASVHAAVVERVTANEIHTIEGDRGRAVARSSYDRGDSRIMGYASMRAMMIAAGALDDAVQEAQELIDALPGVEKLSGMDIDAQRAAYEQTQAAYDAYMALTEEQRAQIEGAEIFETLFAFFNGQILLLAQYSGGDGTEKNPFVIATPQDMWTLAANSDDWDKHFVLTDSFDLGCTADNQWLPIGGNGQPFKGAFDGGENTISGLYIETTSKYQGLFGYISDGSVVNLHVAGTVTAGGNVGGIVGFLEPIKSDAGRIEGCSFEGNVNGGNGGNGGNSSTEMYTGGIVGYNHGGQVIGCQNSATVNCTTANVGGIVGENIGNTARVDGCINIGTVNLSGKDTKSAGGIAGLNLAGAKIINCRNEGAVDGTESSGLIGGIVGQATADVTNCHNDGAVKGSSYVGGVVGQNNGAKITLSYNTADVSGDSYVGGVVGLSATSSTIAECYSSARTVSGTGSCIGGIVGQNAATVRNCYSDGEVKGDSYVGGIVGQNALEGGSAKSSKAGTVVNSYSRGSVSGKSFGGVVGANANKYVKGTVTNCYYLNGSAAGGIDGSDAVGQAEAKTEADFASGEIAWRLYHGNSGAVWGQELVKEKKDRFPLLMNTGVGCGSPKVLKVTFQTETNKSYQINYTNSGGDVPAPTGELATDSNHAFYEWHVGKVDGDKYEGVVTANDDVIIVATQRERFGGEDEQTTVVRGVYGETIEKNLDSFVGYASGMTSTAGKFTYTITDSDGLDNAVMNGNVLTVAAGANVNEAGYVLKITAHEEQPQISLLSIGDVGVDDVTLSVRVIIEKATPVLDVTASPIDFGQKLGESKLTGTASHPTTGASVAGAFAWDAPETAPGVVEAAKVGYSVTFTPEDAHNYNAAKAIVKLTVNKVAPIYTAPMANDGIYSGLAQNLIIAGATEDGTMAYRLDGDGDDYSETIPARANAGVYRVWYVVFGDENHKDTEPQFIEATISPYELVIPAQRFTYNGSAGLTLTLEGVNDETVTVALTAYSKDAGSYTYGAAGAGRYTAEIAAPNDVNYAVKEDSGALTIDRRPAILRWNEELTFTYRSGVTHTVTAAVSNKADGDEDSDFGLQYRDNAKTDVGEYTAVVVELGNENYTLGDGAQNVSQVWHITKEQKTIALEQVAPITYGDELTLTLSIGPDSSGMSETDTVEFYANGLLLPGKAKIDDDGSTATLTVENAVSKLGFCVGANAVSVKYSGNSNEEAAESDAISIIVNPKPIAAEIAGENTVKTYDGDNIASGLELTLEGVEDCDEGFVSAAAKSFTYNSANVEQASTITANGVELSGEQSGNYSVEDSAQTDGRIVPKTVKLEWKGMTGLVYTGNPVNVTATATELVPGEACTVAVDHGAEISANTYTAVARGVDNPNYVLPDDGTTQQKYTILPAQMIVPEQTVTYNGKNVFSVELDGVTPEGGATEKVAVTLTSGKADAGEYAFTAQGAEGYAYTASTADTNYEIVNGATLTIQKAVPNVTWPRFNGVVYVNDEPLTTAYFTSGSATGVDGGDLPGAFSLSGMLSWTASGTYFVTFTFTPDDSVNYVDVTTDDVTVTVNKRHVASVEAQRSVTGKPYGTEQDQLGLPATVTITTEDGKTFYNVPVTWSGYDSKSLAEQSLVGSLDLSAIAEEVENPSGVQAAIKVTLKPLEPGVVEYGDKTVVYSGLPVSHEIDGAIAGVTGVSYEYEGEEGTLYSPSSEGPTDVGAYAVTATFAMEAGYAPLSPVTVRLVIVKADPTVTAPTANDRVYDGVARDLVAAGSAVGGTMAYSLEKDGGYSSTIPARANAGDYTVWYRVEGDANHNDAGPWAVPVAISPAVVDLVPGHVVYNGGSTFLLTLDGVQLDENTSETVTATLTAYSANAGEYAYADETGSGKYTATLSSSNYVVRDAAVLTVDPLPAVFAWSEQLTFTYNGQTHTVTAAVSNAIGDDAFELSFADNTAVNEGEYIAVVTGLGNANYTLDGAVNATQTWYITRESEIVALAADERVTYGDELTLAVTITPAADVIRLMAAAPDEVEFYANGELLDSVPVTYAEGGRDSGTATLTVKATSANHFCAGNANAVMAVYGGNSNVNGGESACVTVTVDAKPVVARITGDAAKTYDGSDTATGLAMKLEGVEDCDAGKVTVSAASYAYEDANAGEGKTVRAQNVSLDGEQRGNYVIANEPVTTTGVIERKTVRLMWSGYMDLVYTGSPVNVTATATELVPGDFCEVEVDNGRQTDAGVYTAEATGLTNPNYALPETGWAQEYTISKADPIVTAPAAKDSVYDGASHELVEAGSVDGGAMRYSTEENGDYSAAIPERTNAGTYTIWYKAIGDRNHNDVGPWPVTAVILPARIDIEPEPVVYNGENAFPITVDGVSGETVTLTLTAFCGDAGEYDYAEEAANGKYTVALPNSNYAVGAAGKLTVNPLAAVLAWSEPLTFTYTGETHTVTAAVSNAIGDDAFSLTYAGNTAINQGEYNAEVVSLGNANYTLNDAVHAAQTWYIVKESEIVTLTADERVVYGDELTLTVKISPAAKSVRLMALEPDKAEFYVNGELLEIVDVAYDSAARDSGTATVTVKATSASHFSAGANAVTAVYSGNGNVNGGGTDAVTVTVEAKPIAAKIAGNADKTYDGSDTATGLAIGLEGVEDCDNGEVTASAIAYTFDNPNAGSGKIVTARNIALDGKQSGNYVLNDAPVTTVSTIAPALLDIPARSFTYNGGTALTVTLDGVNGETVIVTLNAYSKDAGDYAHAAEAGNGRYTAQLSSPNYAVGETGMLSIVPLAAVLQWGEPLVFTYDGMEHGVTATVSNKTDSDEDVDFALTYEGNTGVNARAYNAAVTGLSSGNYTLDGAQNVTQTWYILQEPESILLTANDPVTYGDELTLTVAITPATNDIRLMAAAQDAVEFYANGELLGSAPVTYADGDHDSGTASLTVRATSVNHFCAGANAVLAMYGGNGNVSGAEATITVTVNAKPIAARITGETSKTYDGNDVATGLAIELDGVEDCDKGQVSATADTYAYNSANVTEADTILAQNVTLDGAQSGNYVLDTAPVMTSGIINPKVVRLEWSGYTDLVYTGEPVNVTATATELIPGDECGVVVENGQEIEAGTYIATATGLTNPNYALPADGTTQEYTISKVDTEDPSGPDDPTPTEEPDGPTPTEEPDGPTPTEEPDGPTPTEEPDGPTPTEEPDGPSNTKKPDKSQGSGTTPKTGDTSRFVLWVLVMAFSFCGIVAMLVGNMRAKKKTRGKTKR